MEAMSLLSLPSELLIQIFSLFSTPALLPLTTISHRVLSLITSILRSRMLRAAPVPGHILFLDCFRPSQRFQKPSLHCSQSNTPNLEHADFTNLRNIYSNFRIGHGARHTLRSRQLNPVPLPQTNGPAYFNPTASIASVSSSQPTFDTLHLDDHELFTQLVIDCSVVSAERSMLRAFAKIQEGVIRVWKEWLDEAAAEGPDNGVRRESNILWINLKRNVGLRINVTKHEHSMYPIRDGVQLGGFDSYTIEFAG